MPFNLSLLELVVVLAVLLLLFGARKLPELGSGLGKGIREFKRSISDAGAELRRDSPDQIQDPGARGGGQVTPGADQADQKEPERARREV
jgi:sec-independent protein translocase protein TatA